MYDLFQSKKALHKGSLLTWICQMRNKMSARVGVIVTVRAPVCSYVLVVIFMFQRIAICSSALQGPSPRFWSILAYGCLGACFGSR